MPRRRLACPNGCDTERFEALNTPLYVDPSGAYAGHDDALASFRCPLCQSVAVDVAAAAREMAEEHLVAPAALLCPGCATEMLPPEDDPLAALVECPLCATRFTPEEGTPRLHGGGSAAADGDGFGADGS